MRSGEIPVLALAVAVVLAIAFTFLVVILTLSKAEWGTNLQSPFFAHPTPNKKDRSNRRGPS